MWLGTDWHSRVRQGRYGGVRFGQARLGPVGLGMAGKVWCRFVGFGQVRQVLHGEVRFMAWSGLAGCGMAGMARRGADWHGKVRQVLHGEVGYGAVRPGWVRYGRQG